MRAGVFYILFFFCQISFGQSIFTSTGGGGNWTDASSWSEDNQGNPNDADGIPDSNDNVVITSGNPIDITTSVGQNCEDLTIADGILTFTASASDIDIEGDLLFNGTATSVMTASTGLATDPRVDLFGSLTVDADATFNLGNIRFDARTTSTINGVIAFTSTSGLKIFTDITLAATGTWNNSIVPEDFSIDGSIVQNGGTWNGCSNTTGCRYTFRTNGATISGIGTVNVTDIRVNNGVTFTNNGNLVVTDNIDGASAPISGVFVNGATGVLSLNDNGAYSEITFALNTVGNTVIYRGANNENINLGPFYDLEIDMATSTTRVDMNGADVTVNNDLTLTRGRMRLQTANTLTVGGNLTITSDSELRPNNSEVIANIGGNLSMSGGIFDHNDGDVNISGDIIITGGNMTMNEGTSPVNPSTIDATDMSVATGSVTLQEGTLTLSGGLTVTSGSLIKDNSDHTLTITGDYDISGGTNDIDLGIITFNNMDITGGGTITVSNPTITSTGTITVDNGTYASDGSSGTYSYNNITVNADGDWNVTTDYDPTINGNIANNGTFTGCSNTACDYLLTSTSGTISGTGAMTDLSDIILNDGASYTNTNSGGLNITSRLTTTSGTGTFINGANGVLSYSATSNSFSVTNFTASAVGNTVIYNRSTGNQDIRLTTDAGNNYYNLVIDRADGADMTMTEDITIDNQLTMTVGDIIMGGQNLIMAAGANISGGGATSYIQDSGSGVLRQLYSASGETLRFPIGDNDDYSPITAFTINSGTFGGSAHLDFSVTDAEQPSRDVVNTGSGGDDVAPASTAYISRFWTVTPNNITNPRYNATYVYVNADVIGTEANMVGTVYRTPPGESFLDWHVGGTVNAGTNTVSVSNIDAFGILYAMDNTLSRLPIVLISFEVKTTESTVELAWVTASEENNDFYTIERSVDGRNFYTVLTVDGAGDSEELLTYKVVDRSPLAGRSFYRLKQTDFNGQFEYSEIRSVFFEGNLETLDIQVYPNPAGINSMFSIKVPQPFLTEYARVSLVNQLGQEVITNQVRTVDGFSFLTNDLKPGLYIILFTDGINHVRKKLMVQ